MTRKAEYPHAIITIIAIYMILRLHDDGPSLTSHAEQIAGFHIAAG